MILKECMAIKNDCYKKNQKMTGNKPTGIVVHSTGANNNTLKRYVQPVSSQACYNEVIADVGKNIYGNSWNRGGLYTCVHAFIGVNKDNTVETYQILPWDVCCWGVGNGKKGSYNYNPVAHIQFEICEDNLKNETYFNAAMKEAQELCAYLCKKFNLPIKSIVSHKEAHDLGYGSDHGDPDYWLKRFGKNMDWFRSEVEKIVNPTPAPTPTPTPKPSPTQKFAIGESVIINGDLYSSANASKPSSSVKNKTTKITRYCKGTKHPYNTTGDLGWMNESSIKKATPTPDKGDAKIKEFQIAANADKNFGLVVDGIWGPKTQEAAKKCICKKRIVYSFKNCTKIVQKVVGVTVDGKFGNATRAAVIKWQKSKGLTQDGYWGYNCWKKYFNK